MLQLMLQQLDVRQAVICRVDNLLGAYGFATFGADAAKRDSSPVNLSSFIFTCSHAAAALARFPVAADFASWVTSP